MLAALAVRQTFPIFVGKRIDMEKDEIFEVAERYIKATGRPVFLTGKAGTGKTTFLKYITETVGKRFIVLAPTGVAAINAGGSTIHSFFQLPLCPYLPDVKELVTEYQMPEKYRSLRKERVKIIRTLDLLIIDEISMVRADLMDAVDMTLRRYRRSSKPFGGVQLLMIGDAQQLSPVVKENEWRYMSRVYPSPYFFHSKALARLPYVTVELKKIYRQRDRDFVDILNSIRENRIDAPLLERLNSRLHAFDDGDDIIRLTTHNSQADSVNVRKLDELPGDPVTFEAYVEGEFPENNFPADSTLTLKKGAQVMFIRNDPDGDFYNGKIGRVDDISPDGVVTVSDQDGGIITVTPVSWENIQYVLDDDSGEISQSVVGTFRQLPLRIAWAITVHKSQGLTFDKVIIDAGAAFAFGQVYVALSRCRSLEGISLDSPIRMSGIYSDSHVSDFNSRMPSAESVEAALPLQERSYYFDCLRDIFDFDDQYVSLQWLRKLWEDHLLNVYPDECHGLIEMVHKIDSCRKTAKTFRDQISRIEAAAMEDDSYLNERLGKAVGYFMPVFEESRTFCLRFADLEIDNRETRKKIKEAYDEVMINLDVSCGAMELIRTGAFTSEALSRLRTECMLKDRSVRTVRKLKKIERPHGEPGIVNEELREKLQQWRSERFKADNVPAYTIMHQSTLMEIASLIPKTEEQLLSIKGFGKKSFEKYGSEILEITSEY